MTNYSQGYTSSEQYRLRTLLNIVLAIYTSITSAVMVVLSLKDKIAYRILNGTATLLVACVVVLPIKDKVTDRLIYIKVFSGKFRR